MLASSPVAAGNTSRLGPKPLADKPGPSNGLGLHVATDGSLADVWHWKSVRSGSIDQFDDNYFGAPMEAKPGRYTGGYTQDPKTGGGFEQNFDRIGQTRLFRGLLSSAEALTMKAQETKAQSRPQSCTFISDRP